MSRTVALHEQNTTELLGARQLLLCYYVIQV